MVFDSHAIILGLMCIFCSYIQLITEALKPIPSGVKLISHIKFHTNAFPNGIENPTPEST